MKNNKLISVSVIMFTFFFFVEAEEVSINFDGNYEKIKMEKNIEINTQAVKLQSDGKIEILQKKTLGDLLNKCSKENKIKFYKSLFFVKGGKLASSSIESIKKCLNENEIIVLMKMIGRQNRGKDERCICDVFHQLNCAWWSWSSCDPTVCSGSCKPGKLVNSYSNGYLDMADLFAEVPEYVAQEFADSIILNNGKVEGFYYGALLRYIGVNETKEILETLIDN
jgi:hypothetical protein